MPDFSIAIGLLKKPFELLSGLASGPLQRKISALKAQSKIKNLHKRLWESQRVKTIWHTDKPRSLTSFFYPVSVEVQSSSGVGVTKVKSLDELPSQHTILSGTVGQGKSIFLRYLLGSELKTGDHIPLLCELRNVGSLTLLAHLSSRFAMLLEIATDDELFSFFASNGKIAFLLDGFDEIAPDQVPRLTQELQDLATRYATCRIVLSSRPDSECRHLTSFETVRIAKLSEADLEPFYKRIGHDAEFAKRLVTAITRSPTGIRKLVGTPLLATLLAISYRASQRIPLEFSEFYEELFQILLVRHDASKLGWRRNRKTKLSDRDFQQVFEAFCFATRKRRLSALSAEEAAQVAKDCLISLKLDSDAQSVVEDIRRVTCLLVEEGNRLQYVHNSVQEFFSAKYVKTRTEAGASSFYRQLLVGGKWLQWSEELVFLRQIDRHRAEKYFFVNDFDTTMKYLLNGEGAFSDAAAVRYLEGMSVRKIESNPKGVPVVSYVINRVRPIQTYALQVLDSRAFNKLFVGTPWTKGFTAEPKSKERTYLAIAADQGQAMYVSTIETVKSAATSLQTEQLESIQRISEAEATTGLINLEGI